MDDGRPLREFPDNYSIKAVGRDTDDFASHARSIVEAVIEEKDSVTHKTRASKNGSYLSVTVYFIARDQAELDNVFTTVNADERVLWVL